MWIMRLQFDRSGISITSAEDETADGYRRYTGGSSASTNYRAEMEQNSKILQFRYHVAPGDLDDDGISIAADASAQPCRRCTQAR